MELICLRRKTVRGATIGELYNNKELICYTLEDEVRQEVGQPVSAWKVPGKTAIPFGRYKVSLEHSGRFGADTITLNNVDGFTEIRVHGGNTAENTEGCPLVGFGIQVNLRQGVPCIEGGSSRPALAELKSLVKKALDAGEPVFWNILTYEYALT